MLTDVALMSAAGIRIAFSDRLGGSSRPPYDSLNLAAHVGDDPVDVDENRTRLLSAIDAIHLRDRLVTAEQVHGDRVHVLRAGDAGAGAYASGGAPPLPGTDAVVITEPEIPVLLLFADCVPVIIVAPGDRRGAAVVHAGWRGALASLPGKAAQVLSSETGTPPQELHAYIGPHIGECCYEVDKELIFLFRDRFDTIAPVAGRLDLAAAVRASLVEAGLRLDHVAESGHCTRDAYHEYFSYRACERTGRQGALAMLTKGA